MNKFIQEFKRLISQERSRFIYYCIQTGFSFLYLIGLLVPFFVGESLINGKVSMAGLIGGVFYTLLVLVLLMIYLLAILSSKSKESKLLYKINSIVGSLIIFWGFLLYFVAFKSNGADLGAGMLFMIIFNAGMWYSIFGEKTMLNAINKFSKPSIPKTENIEDSKQQ
ncbi:MAG: hypothetical protein ABH890_07240 [Bacillota bacterium]